jgi:hypothetical protein
MGEKGSIILGWRSLKLGLEHERAASRSIIAI